MRRVRLPGPTAGLRIGLFGGSFHPAHSGHLLVAETAMRRLQLDWVWWVVARGNPLKTSHGDFSARLASARAVARNPRMIVTDIEARLGLTYTHDTLSAIVGQAPGAHFVWLMGADNMVGFHHWEDWRGIAGTLPIAVVARPGVGPGARNSPFARRYAKYRIPASAARTLATTPPPAWTYLTAPLDPTSSTALRNGDT
ncbi:nicotinate-nucleotide adenylyltransferase [Hyphomonas johnsonii]|uniref:Probable nicotinate-nucleotide adenylyltransferase n=1 Tax=Hyphomonas johnsonii MHS-2 TaxID=1280950 RepID=A0A059FME2_9PROT|nr:nicotinate-nucleotide adenylyltransferase [Hyphomonas johnsonii]KCZ91618.1 nicotinic acid mononucleotide adenylyltransferase [Hyphomonas johnsonii MHS-2]